ncbi:MAG: alpha-amylase [Treponema sp.]|nr:alpha-amylase [Treponema sp.]
MNEKRTLNPQSGVYYSLFTRSFADSDGDGIGDFNGIISKLDYLERLGITGIWLLPIYPSHSYHGYDVDDYYNVNPEYGTMEDFERLCSECAKRGIAVILDITFNHSSMHNPWFVQSADANNPKHSWYRWASPQDEEINLKATTWNHKVWNELGENYYSGIYSHGMPDYNHDNPELRAEFKKIMKFWLSKGASGFRFDAANHLYDAVKLPSSVKDGQERAVQFWKEMADYVLSLKPDAYMVGEVWDTAGVRADYMRGLPSTFHFDLGTKIIFAVKNSSASNNALAKGLQNDYALAAQKNPSFIDAPFMTNHDQNRFALQFKNNVDSIKLAASMYLFLPGIPFVYYGEELGMNGAKPDEQIRSPFVWSKNQDGAQTKWLDSKYNAKTVPADKQNADKNSILNFYRKAIKFRTKNAGAFEGKFIPNKCENTFVISWIIESEGQRLYCYYNLSDKAQELAKPDAFGEAKLLFCPKKDAKITKEKLLLPARACALFGSKGM